MDLKSLTNDPNSLLPSKLAAEEAAKLQRSIEAGLTGYQTGGIGAVGPMTCADAEKALGLDLLAAPRDPRHYGAIDRDEMERKSRERQEQELTERAVESAQRMHRQIAEARARENENTSYLRRSAEASEAVLAEERRKKEAAELAATQAKADKEIAEARADRAEHREVRMERLAILATIVAVIALAFAALPYI